jgi:hypothetical protein
VTTAIRPFQEVLCLTLTMKRSCIPRETSVSLLSQRCRSINWA